jgi:ribosomal protein L37AE/L43A
MTTDIEQRCSHPGGFRTEDGGWECSRCGHLFDSYEAWGAETGNEAAVAAVKASIAADLADMHARGLRT